MGTTLKPRSILFGYRDPFGILGTPWGFGLRALRMGAGLGVSAVKNAHGVKGLF